MIWKALFTSSSGIPAKLSEDRAGWKARCTRVFSVTFVPSRLRVCRVDSCDKADTSMIWKKQTPTKARTCHQKKNTLMAIQNAGCDSTFVFLMLRFRSCGTQRGRATSVASVTAVWFRLSWERQGGTDWRYSTIPASVTLVWSRNRKHRLLKPCTHTKKRMLERGNNH